MSTDYQLLTFEIASDQVDLVSGLLHENFCLGLEEQPKGAAVFIRSYFEENADLKTVCSLLEDFHPSHLTIIRFGAADFKFNPQPFDPIELVENTWIIPPDDMPMEEAAPQGQHLIIRPGTAFGTGRHESTRLASKAIRDVVQVGSQQNLSLLDLGSGSGVLAIFARTMGIKNITAVEIDEQACENALENFQLNGMEDIKLLNNLKDVSEKFDVLVANILTPTHLHLKQEMLARLKPGGFLILSGITQDENTQIETAFSSLKLSKKYQEKEWVCFSFVQTN